MRALLPTVICLAGIRILDLWHDAMITLNMTLVATLLVMVLAVVLGVWMARRDRADLVHASAARRRPDDPRVRLPDPGAGPVRSDPVHRDRRRRRVRRSGRHQAGGRRREGACRRPRVEASRSTGTTAWQEITQVQLPMAKGSLVLATNQGLLYVLAMVVIGGLVGRRRPRLRHRARLLAQRGVGQGRRRRASRSCCSAIMIDRIAHAASERAAPSSRIRAQWWRPVRDR